MDMCGRVLLAGKVLVSDSYPSYVQPNVLDFIHMFE